MTSPELWPVAGAAPRQVRLGPGYYLICVRGMAWVTRQSDDRDEAERDIVLCAGDQLRARGHELCFVSALHGEPAWLTVRAPGAPPLIHTLNLMPILKETHACPT